MNKVLSLRESSPPAEQEHSNAFTARQIDILKNSICKGVSNEEFEIFLMACTKSKLDPFMRQIYAVKRRMKKPDGTWGEAMTIQTGIDGYRLIAERTEMYAPGPEPTYIYDDEKNLISATAYIKKLTRDGTWHVVSASAYLDEYCQKTREGQPLGLWATMPRTMLAKCAESQALRKAFPAEMSGIYTKEEMAQADAHEIIQKITLEQAAELEVILSECDEAYKKLVSDYLKNKFKTDSLVDLPAELFDRMKTAALKNMNENFARQQKSTEESNDTIVG